MWATKKNNHVPSSAGRGRSTRPGHKYALDPPPPETHHSYISCSLYSLDKPTQKEISVCMKATRDSEWPGVLKPLLYHIQMTFVSSHRYCIVEPHQHRVVRAARPNKPLMIYFYPVSVILTRPDVLSPPLRPPAETPVETNEPSASTHTLLEVIIACSSWTNV